MKTIKNFINGCWVDSSGSNFMDVFNPTTADRIASVPISGQEDLAKAVAAAKSAFPGWRETPPVDRARYMFKFKALLEDHFEELAELIVVENGKTLNEARGSVRRGIECVEVATGIPSLMMGETLEDVSSGIDTQAVRRPMGVFAAITPFNFPVMVPLWFLPFAVACGNTFILKPSEQVPLSMVRIFELLEQTGLPKGVINLVNGAKEVVDSICVHPDILGVSFVGSSPVAEHVYRLSSQHGKRVQSLGGAKNFMVVLPDADMEKTVEALIASCFGCAGERCLAGSVILVAGEIYSEFKTKIIDSARKLKLGSGLDRDITLGPVISAAHKERVLGYIQKGMEEGADLILDGRNPKVQDGQNGYFVGATIFEKVTPDMTIAQEEIFGPVIALIEVKDLKEAIDIIQTHHLANTTSIFTQSGKAAREFKYRVDASMIGVNIGVPAPMSFFSFGGAKGSFFGDLKAHGRDAIGFYTDKKVVISRW